MAAELLSPKEIYEKAAKAREAAANIGGISAARAFGVEIATLIAHLALHLHNQAKKEG